MQKEEVVRKADSGMERMIQAQPTSRALPQNYFPASRGVKIASEIIFQPFGAAE
jgi:hypothetical protein